MTSIANGESGSSVRTKLNAALLQADALQLGSRAALVSLGSYTNGALYSDGEHLYRGSTGATAIPDIDGLVPVAPYNLAQWGVVPETNTGQKTSSEDWATEIQAAIDWMQENGGGVLSAGTGVIAFNSTIYMGDGTYPVLLVGEGRGITGAGKTAVRASAATRFLWGGSATVKSFVLTSDRTNGGAATRNGGGGVLDIMFDGAEIGTAATSIPSADVFGTSCANGGWLFNVISHSGHHLRLHLAYRPGGCFLSTCLSNGLASGPADTQRGVWDIWTSDANTAAEPYAHVLITGSSAQTANTSLMDSIRMTLRPESTAIAAHLEFSDGSVFDYLDASTRTTASGDGGKIILHADDTLTTYHGGAYTSQGHCRRHTFNHIQSKSELDALATVAGSSNSGPNTVHTWSRGNGAARPRVEAGAVLNYWDEEEGIAAPGWLSKASRAELVTFCSNYTPIPGAIYSDGTVQYVGQAGATVIPDLPGLVPFGVATPKHFGADGLGAGTLLSSVYGSLAAAQAVYSHATALTQSVDWAAVQAAIYYSTDQIYTVSGATDTNIQSGRQFHLDCAAGAYYLNYSLDLTNIRDFNSFNIDARGAVFRCIGDGNYPALDAGNSRRLSWYGGTFISDEGTPCRVIAQMGRPSDGGGAEITAGHIRFIDCEFKGPVSFCGLYNFASERSSLERVIIRTQGSTDATYGLVIDGDRYWDMYSRYYTIATANTAESFLSFSTYDCDVRHTGSGRAIWMGATQSHRHHNLYAVCDDASGGAAVVLFSNTFNTSNNDLLLDLHSETDAGDADAGTGLDHIVYFDAASAGTTIVQRGLKMSDASLHAAVSVFAKSANVSAVHFYDSDIRPGRVQNDVSQTLFDTASAYLYSGDLHLFNASDSISLAGIGSLAGRVQVNDQSLSEFQIDDYSYWMQGLTRMYLMNILQGMASSAGAWDRRIYNTSEVIGYRETINVSSSTVTWKLDGSTDHYLWTASAYYPGADNTRQLGLTNRRWSTVWGTTIDGTTMRGASIRASSALGWQTGVGAGGTVTQATSKTTGVTLNKKTGVITTTADALASGASVVFGVTNSVATALSIPTVCVVTPAQKYRAEIVSVYSGGFDIRLTNITGGSLSEAVAINFALLEAAND